MNVRLAEFDSDLERLVPVLRELRRAFYCITFRTLLCTGREGPQEDRSE